ncbi:hypothetical protein ABW19_dt0208934 [Dactylella cylindrospora]|nr:hypothetical protein ABW19_dt0208934 [Dactylella cylindrospora]
MRFSVIFISALRASLASGANIWRQSESSNDLDTVDAVLQHANSPVILDKRTEDNPVENENSSAALIAGSVDVSTTTVPETTILTTVHASNGSQGNPVVQSSLLATPVTAVNAIVTPIVTQITQVIPLATTTITHTPPNGVPQVLFSTIRTTHTPIRTFIVENHNHTTITRNYTLASTSTTIFPSTTTTFIPWVVETTITEIVTVTRVYESAFNSWELFYYTTERPVVEVAVGEVTGQLTTHPITRTVYTTLTTTEEVFPSFIATTIFEGGVTRTTTLHVHHHADDFGIHEGQSDSGAVASHQSGHADETHTVSYTTYTTLLSVPSHQNPSPQVNVIPAAPTTSSLIPSAIPTPAASSHSSNLASLTEVGSTSTFLTTSLVTLSRNLTTVIGIPTHIPAVSLFTSVQNIVVTIETVLTYTGVPTTFSIPVTSLVTFSSIRTPSVSIPSNLVIPTLSIVLSHTLPTVSRPSLSVPTLPLISIPSISIPRISTIYATLASVPVPSVSIPRISVPSVTTPRVSVPTIAHPTIGGPPRVNENSEAHGQSPQNQDVMDSNAQNMEVMPVQADAPHDQEFRIRGGSYDRETADE